MADSACFKCIFLPIKAKTSIVKSLVYIYLLVKTVYLLRLEKPDTVWVQLPQIPILWAALIYQSLSQTKIKIVADCHNAQLRAPWRYFPFTLWSLSRSDVILVHNEVMLEKARNIGWPMDKVLVLEDVPSIGKDKLRTGTFWENVPAPRPLIVIPGSFSADEPIKEILAAARIASECTFILTGRAERAEQNGHNISELPKNVICPGFLSITDFDNLLIEADVVMGLTCEEGIQLSVCNEALGFGRPLVTSDTKILRKLFGEAAVLVDTTNPVSIAAGCREALGSADKYACKSRALSVSRISQWKSGQLRDLLIRLNSV